MKKLFDEITIRNKVLRNRIVVPPMVMFNWSDHAGFVSDKHVEHYKQISNGNPGLIIQEATCISKTGRLVDSQLGIWDDKFIPGLQRITNAVHQNGCPIVVQIHHAGIVGIEEENVCPSAYKMKWRDGERVGKELTVDGLKEIQSQFIEAACRAYEAGYDGVELHGCHNYFLCQLLNSRVNTRDDIYGKDPVGYISEIMSGIRKLTNDDFIIGIRLGGFEPTLEMAIEHAKKLEEAGIDYINVSFGFGVESIMQVPESFANNPIHYAAKMIKDSVATPVFAVNLITSKKEAQDIIDTCGVDMINVGRGVLVNYNWADDALHDRDTGKCLHCKVCQWRIDSTRCAGKVLYERNKTVLRQP